MSFLSYGHTMRSILPLRSRATYEYEYYAMLEASDQVRPIVADKPLRILEKYREARAEGISFYNIDWNDD